MLTASVALLVLAVCSSLHVVAPAQAASDTCSTGGADEGNENPGADGQYQDRERTLMFISIDVGAMQT